MRPALLALLACSLCLSASALEQYRVAVSDLRVAVDGAEGGNSERIPYPQLLKETLLLSPEHTLQVSFTLKDQSSGLGVTPQQVMVRATGAGNAQAFLLARSVADGAEGARAAAVTSAALAKQLGPVDGRVTLTLLIGDVAVSNSIQWDFAQVGGTKSLKPQITLSPKALKLQGCQVGFVTSPLGEGLARGL
jgi:hypothetical protein